MNKKFIIAWIVIFIAWFLGSFVVHGLLLHSDYLQLPNLFRTEADGHDYFPLMVLAHVILVRFSCLDLCPRRRGETVDGPGLRFGIAILRSSGGTNLHDLLRGAADAGGMVVKQIVYDVCSWLFSG